MQESETDEAGHAYWNDRWHTTPLPPTWNVRSRDLRHHVRRSLFARMVETFARNGQLGPDRQLIEVGCARSAVLPLFATECSFRIAGLDYSPDGCEQARVMLKREGVEGDIRCADVFRIPKDFAERFDVVVSFGLVEHFADTASIVSALSTLLRPGGLMFTSVPNLAGMPGRLQRMLDRRTYDCHVPLTTGALGQAHERAGLRVTDCRYFLSSNFGVLNLNSIPPGTLEWHLKRVALTCLRGLSVLTWCLERLTGELPRGPAFSPYIHCVAVKP